MTTSSDQLRIVLIGRTGNGKSLTGNSLLHSLTAFRSIQSATSITKDCESKTGQWTDSDGRRKEIMVVDTPGFFDTDPNITNQMVEKKITSEIFKMTTPGVHAFLIVLRIGRYSPEEKEAVDFIKTIFGKDAAKYCIVIFTHEDQLGEGQTVDDFISSSSALQQLVNICGNRKLTINNKLAGQPLEKKTQQLQQMIQEMVNNNNGTYYTNAEYKRIEKEREDEQERLKKIAAKVEKEKIDAEIARLNEVVKTRTETQTVEIGRSVAPIMSTERTRKKGIGGWVSIDGSGYDYREVQVGSRTTITKRTEQRKINTLRSGREEFGDWKLVRQWSE